MTRISGCFVGSEWFGASRAAASVLLSPADKERDLQAAIQSVKDYLGSKPNKSVEERIVSDSVLARSTKDAKQLIVAER